MSESTAQPVNASSSAGSVDDALEPMAAALASAARTAAREAGGDPKVIAAVNLGWVMQELSTRSPTQPIPPIRLDPGQTLDAQHRQLATWLDVLRLPQLDSSCPALHRLTQAGAADRQKETVSFEGALVVALVGADTRYPHAYRLGNELRAMLASSGAGPQVFGSPSKALVGALDTLSADLPSHAARSVSLSLSSWAGSEETLSAQLRCAQVNLWRAVLVGEKLGRELLEPENYLDAARALERRYLRRAFTNPWLIALGLSALALFCGGIAFLLLDSSDATHVAVGLSGVLGALGLTWKGIGGSIGKLMAKVEVPVWGAELDVAIAEVLTLSANPDATPTGPAEFGYANRRARALAPGQLPGV